MKPKEYKSERYNTTFTQRPDNTIFGMWAGKDEFSLAVAKLGSIVDDPEFRTKFGLPSKEADPAQVIETAPSAEPERRITTLIKRIRNLTAAATGIAVANVALYALFREYFNLIPRNDIPGVTPEEARHWFAIFDTGMMDILAMMMMFQIIESRQKVPLTQRITNTLERGLNGLRKLGRNSSKETEAQS